MSLRARADTVKEAAKIIQQGMDMLRGGPLSFYLEEICGAVEYLMDRYSPIKAGDRVELIETPEISETVSWGWLSAKHFLVAGARGAVDHVECGSDGIRVYVVWDDESWIDRDGMRRPVSRPSLYCHREVSLKNVTPVAATPE